MPEYLFRSHTLPERLSRFAKYAKTSFSMPKLLCPFVYLIVTILSVAFTKLEQLSPIVYMFTMPDRLSLILYYARMTVHTRFLSQNDCHQPISIQKRLSLSVTLPERLSLIVIMPERLPLIVNYAITTVTNRLLCQNSCHHLFIIPERLPPIVY